MDTAGREGVGHSIKPDHSLLKCPSWKLSGSNSPCAGHPFYCNFSHLPECCDYHLFSHPIKPVLTVVTRHPPPSCTEQLRTPFCTGHLKSSICSYFSSADSLSEINSVIKQYLYSELCRVKGDVLPLAILFLLLGLLIISCPVPASIWSER